MKYNILITISFIFALTKDPKNKVFERVFY
jgi:hypothetical protein